MDQKYRVLEPSLLSTKRNDLLRFLEEDIGYGDLSSRVIADDMNVEGRIFVKEDCTVAGIEEAMGIFGILRVPVLSMARDGQAIREGKTVLKLKGDLRSILAGERLTLNMLSRMSGIATLTRDLVEKMQEMNPNIRVACTRKTTPGFRFFEKKAVILGGGDPHRFRLDDAILLKDNHLKKMGSIEECVRKAKDFSFSKKVEVEVESLEEALEASGAGADIVMLDNMPPIPAKKCYKALKKKFPSVIVEVSGGITPANILGYADCADVISLGYLTHSYKAVDFSLELD